MMSLSLQAYLSSFLVSSVWINQTLAVLVFSNSVANTVVHYYFNARVGLCRLYITIIDLIVDFVWGVVVPCRIMLGISVMFDWSSSFSEDFNYSDTLFIKVVLESRQVFMVSSLDTVTTTLPYITMLLGLRSMKFLLQHNIDLVRASSSTKGPSTDILNRMAKSRRGVAPELILPQVHVPSEIHRQVETKRRCSKRFVIATASLMPLCGAFVLLTSVIASGVFFQEDTCALGCKLRMFPWFTHECSCSVLEINCFERYNTGGEDDLHAIFQSLDTRVLNTLIISHCPELSTVEDIRRFGKLTILELYNSTVVTWPASASLSLPYVPFLATVYIVRCRLIGGLPDGMTTDLSPSVLDIELVASDLGGPLPDNLNILWPSVSMLYIEHCGLQEFPPATANMEITDLSLIGTNISAIPEDLNLSGESMFVMLDRNPLEHIPDSLESLENLCFLTVQYTNIVSLPRWLQGAEAKDASINFLALGTPYCRALPPESPSAAFAWCDTDDYSSGIFPLEMGDKMRAIHPVQ